MRGISLNYSAQCGTAIYYCNKVVLLESLMTIFRIHISDSKASIYSVSSSACNTSVWVKGVRGNLHVTTAPNFMPNSKRNFDL